MTTVVENRDRYIQTICTEIITTKQPSQTQVSANQLLPYPSFADGDSQSSVAIARCLAQLIGYNEPKRKRHLSVQTTSMRFETATCSFVQNAFDSMYYLRPGRWTYAPYVTATNQFEHDGRLAELAPALQDYSAFKATPGRDNCFFAGPDIVVSRLPLSDTDIDDVDTALSMGGDAALVRSLRRVNLSGIPCELMHASISCKWTIRMGDTSAVPSEVFNLIRNRNGRLPHIVLVTAESLPTRLALVALGTVDLDCVYHFALSELSEAVRMVGSADQQDVLELMISERRLRDIADLPFDLAK